MYCIKNQSIGVSLGALLNIFQIFEYLTAGLFGQPLSANFTDAQKVHLIFSTTCILNFDPKTSIKL